MELFLKKTSIDDILRGKSSQLVSKRDETEKQLNHARNKSRSEVTRLLVHSDRKAAQTRDAVDRDLQRQADRLEERIQKRRTMSNRSSRTNEPEDDN